MSRLASFHGPSTPSKVPVKSPEQASPSPSSKPKKPYKAKQNTKNTSVHSPDPSSPPSTPTRKQGAVADLPIREVSFVFESDFVETTVHKRLRQILLEIRNATRQWDELTKIEGFKAAKEIVDARTLIENALAAVPKDGLPSKPVVKPNMQIINGGISKLDAMISSLKLLFKRVTTLVDSLETLHIQSLNEFHTILSTKHQPATLQLDPQAPLWPTTTWSLAQFCQFIPPLILPYYYRSLSWHQSKVKLLSTSTMKWEQARAILVAWRVGDYWIDRVVAGRNRKVLGIGGIFLDSGWSAEFEDICAVEIHGWK